MIIDLIYLTKHTTQTPQWALGDVYPATADVQGISRAVDQLLAANPNLDDHYCLFWDAMLGLPDADTMLEAVQLPGDGWHGGLRLQMGGRPRLLDFVNPVWRFSRDPAADIVATSWRLSLRACLVRTAVLAQLGGPDPCFETLDGASLELGHRWITRGAQLRHVPWLLPAEIPAAVLYAGQDSAERELADEFRLLFRGYGRMWATWALWRSLKQRRTIKRSGWKLWRAFQAARQEATPPLPAPLRPATADAPKPPLHSQPSVTILIPTLDRYPHLFNLLDQLRQQQVRPLEIIVVDQTTTAERQTDWPERFADLPLQVIWRDQAGQCSSRNAGLQLARGDMVLFLDDDDEVQPDLIARHLSFMAEHRVDASCGVAEEAGAGALPVAFTYVRDSDVFPTNNSLLRRQSLCASGLFDLAYEKGERADGDLGMRLYLAGQLLVLNPDASVLHLHAPRGGLRQHGGRVVTRSASRSSLFQRHLLAPTEGYLWLRYFTPQQVNEALLIRAVSTLRGESGRLRRLARALVMALLLPNTLRQNRARLQQGRQMLDHYPQIPTLHSDF